MRIRLFTILIFLFFLPGKIGAQSKGEAQQSRILILLDGSSSMLEKWGGDKNRFQAGSDIILKLIDSVYRINKDVEFSLRVYGHQHTVSEQDCHDTRNEVEFSKNNYTQMEFRLSSLQPLGVTPIAYSLQQAAENDLVDEAHYAYSIILITDGGESCGGDICQVVKDLIQKKVYFKPYIVSLIDYAPLRAEYACLGSYLQVTSEKDIPKLVNTLVDSFHTMLTLSKTDYTEITKILAHPPSALGVDIPSVTVTKKEEPKPVVVTKPPVKEEPKPVVIDKPVPKPKEEPKKEEPKPVVVTPPPPPPTPVPPKDTTKHVIKTAQIDSIWPRDKAEAKRVSHNRKINTLPVAYLIETVAPLQVPYFADPKIKPETPASGSNPAPGTTANGAGNKTNPTAAADKPGKPIKPVKAPPAENKKPMKLDVSSSDASETTLEIFFSDPKKEKFYYTTPLLSLVDARTKKVVKKFHRTIDASGNPDPQKDIQPGEYYLIIDGKGTGDMQTDSFRLDPKMRNSIYVKVSNGTLHFEYESDPKKPVNEYTAVVFQRLEAAGKRVRQKCSMNLEYEPGNYYIEVNTLPVSKFNTDIEFGSTSVLIIPEPGIVNFTNTNNLGKIQLYVPLGDRYSKFYTMDIPGNPASQKLELKPGIYQAHFLRDPKMSLAGETIVPFIVKSNQTTEVELK